MIPVVVFWETYTVRARGRGLKVVRCENCATEYVYVLEREGLGVDTTVYGIIGTEGHAHSAAAETLRSALENDFDPVPCPVCGQYQRYMFPKLLETKGMGGLFVLLAAAGVGTIAAFGAVRAGLAYLSHPNRHDLGNLVAAGTVVLLSCLVGLGRAILNGRRVRHFNPNAEDPQTRIALGRSRAITRAEFEKMRQETERGEAIPPQGGQVGGQVFETESECCHRSS